MMNHAEKIQMVIDGLDECITRKDLLLWMERLWGSGHTKFYLLATSREEKEIKSALEQWLDQDNSISIQQNLVNSDICEYIHKRLREGYGFERWHSVPHVLGEIETELMEKAGGM